jgi:uncharacterized protein
MTSVLATSMKKTSRFESAGNDANSLVIIGASTRAACQSANLAGFECWCIDQFGDADLVENAVEVAVSQDWPNDIVSKTRDILRRNPSAEILLAGGLENHIDVVADLSQLAPLVGCSAEQITKLRDPVWLQRTLFESGLPTLAIRTTEPLDASLQWIQKPYQSAGGIGVRRISATGTASVQSHDELNSTRRANYAQEYIGSSMDTQRDFSGLYLADGQQSQLLGVSEQMIGERAAGASGFQYSGSVGPIFLRGAKAEPIHSHRPMDNSEQLFAQADAIGNAILPNNAVGLVGLDFVHDSASGTLYCIEVNPRYTSSIEVYERVHGWPTIAWHIAACRGELIQSFASNRPINTGSQDSRGGRPVAAKLVVYATRESLSPNWDRLRARPDWDVSIIVADRPSEGTQLLTGQPVCTLLTDGTTSQDCKSRLFAAVELLDV